MALPANCRILLFFLFIILIAPVAAALSDIPPGSPGMTSTNRSVPYTIVLFIPKSNMIHSTQIMDMVDIPTPEKGDVVIATSFGLSTYNGTWSTRHMTMDNISEGLIDDYITAVEYDQNLSLWIGYSKGIQIDNGQYYQTFRDQQLFKDTRIHDLQRWNTDMWIATGHSGIHRYRNGTWTWYQPESRNGPGFYEIDSMTVDTTSNASALIIATVHEGLWIVRSPDDPIRFDCIAGKDSTYGLLEHVKRDPQGGVYFFNNTCIFHYAQDPGFSEVLDRHDLSISDIAINDMAASLNDGKIYIGTDTGMYIWDHGTVYRHLNRFEGIGTSSVVNTVNIDDLNRVWFSTQDDVGYYIDRTETQTALAFDTPAPVTSPETDRTPVAGITPDPGNAVNLSPSGSETPEPGGIGAIIDPLVRALRSLFSPFGVTI
jgi:ligand-binding sensor domain-containing protein